MGTYVMFTRLSHDALRAANAPEELCRAVMERVHRECPDVGWKLSYAVLGGPADYLDIFMAPDIETADVGLPQGQMGNSEVGHLSIGAGRACLTALSAESSRHPQPSRTTSITGRRSCIAGTFHEIDRCARSVAPGCDSERSFRCPFGEAQRAVGCSGGPIDGAGQHARSNDIANGYAYKAATKRRQRH